MPRFNPLLQYDKRQITQHELTCGFNTGDPSQPRTANSGFDCRFDTANSLFGFCPTTVIAASDCGLAGCCVDTFSCSEGCGIRGSPDITTFTCNLPNQMHCSTALLTDSVNDVYSYIACGDNAVPEHLFAVATPQTTSVSSTSSTLAAAASRPTTSLASLTTSTSVSNTLSSSTSTTILLSSGSSTAIPQPSGEAATGPIIGGTIGGLAVIAFFTLGIMFLRRYNKQPRVGTPPSPRHSRSYRHTLPSIQTTGLHEKEGTIPVAKEQQSKAGEPQPSDSLRGEAVFELGP